ncbi:MAG: glycosyl hydrolase [Crocinitomicaceae bacterium]
MKKTIYLLLLLCSIHFSYAQKVEFEKLLKDDISIRAIQIWEGKVWYAGTDAKFGYVSLSDSTDKKQIRLSSDKLQFRTLAQDKTSFYAINIESPAYFFKIDKQTLEAEIVFTDTSKTAFYDALKFVDSSYVIALSDPKKNNKLNLTISKNSGNKWSNIQENKGIPILKKGEAAFAASNTNIASQGKYVWIATGGKKSRIIRMKNKNWEIFETPFIQGTATQGIYSIDFYDENFGIAVGGDYSIQKANINNIATTMDGGATWQIQASGKNGGYKTCVKIRPNSKGKDIIAVGDKNIEYSTDYGKTWQTISNEKDLYACGWTDEFTVILAGKNRIVKMKFID